MPRTTAIRVTVAVVCVVGIVGMIVGSATHHNGAAITFGLVTAVAVLCQMSATTALNEARGAPGAPLGPGAAPASPVTPPSSSDAAQLEDAIQALVSAGADEQAVRDLVRRAVRFGRRTGSAVPPDS
jgi:hypothetical protein